MGNALTPDELLERFSNQKILVLGDVMLDWFIWGNVSRISPEAPVPVVEVQDESRYPGGAANVARNMSPFGPELHLAGVFGQDANGDLLQETLERFGIGVDCCIRQETMRTITKTRVVARHQQVVRIDREERFRMAEDQVDELLSRMTNLLPTLDGVVIEDYGKGLITAELVKRFLGELGEKRPVVTVDPKPANPIKWRNVTTVKPNRAEAFACAGLEDLNG
ncbi:MAG: PfkB family carbohydrate kinase, partial [Verrucomicrobiota bacterium]